MPGSNEHHWILLRGLSRERAHWGDFPKQLEDLSICTKAHCLELPGVGAKKNRTCPLSIAQYTKDIEVDFNILKNKYKNAQWSILAISMGGMVAMDWVEKCPNLFSNVLIINSSASNLTAFYKRLTFNAIGKMSRLFLGNNVYTREKAILELTVNIKDITEELVQRNVQIDQSNPLTRKNFFNQLVAASRYKIPKQLYPDPIILVSVKDRLVSSSSSYAIAKLFNSTIKVHPEAGHDLILDDPQWILDICNSLGNS